MGSSSYQRGEVTASPLLLDEADKVEVLADITLPSIARARSNGASLPFCLRKLPALVPSPSNHGWCVGRGSNGVRLLAAGEGRRRLVKRDYPCSNLPFSPPAEAKLTNI